MRMAALMEVMREDKELKSVYLIGQDYSFGQAVLREAKKQLAAQRPDVAMVGDELHPVGRVKDFAPYAVKIKASGAQAVVTGNWGNDLTLLVKAAREVGYDGSFYTFYGNALGAPAAMGDAGIGKVVAVADWLPNVPGAQSEAFYQSFRERFPKPQDDYVHMRMQLMIEALAQSIERAGSTDVVAVARRWKRPACSWPARAAACARPTTSFSSRWPWA
jgi:branched-chain amino acid transport system substrate-binding protein